MTLPFEKTASPSGEKKHIVIVGASFAGLAAARVLSADKSTKVTLIDGRDFFEYVPSNHFGLAGVVDHKSNVAKLAKCCPRGVEFRQAKVTRVADGHVELEAPFPIETTDDILLPEDEAKQQPDVLPFDGCLICTGSSYPGPIRTPTLGHDSRLKEVKNSASELKSAQNVVLLGAGLVGVEMAAEIACKFPKKTVFLLDLADRVLPLLPEKASNRAEARLRDLGVKLILGVRSRVEGKAVHLPNGEVIRADIIYRCFGLRPQMEMVEDDRVKGRLGLQVEDDLRVPYYKSPVFAAGDVIDLSKQDVGKTGFMAEELGDLAARNLLHVLKETDGPTKTVQRLYGTKKAPTVVAVSLGAGCGMIVINELVLGGSANLFGRLLLFGKEFLGWAIKGTARNECLAKCISNTGHVATNYLVSTPLIWRLFSSKLEVATA